MKKASFALLAVLSLAMFSFIKQPRTAAFTKLGATMYKSQTAVTLKPEDQQNIKNILAKQYKIESFKGETTLTYQKVYDPKDPTKLIGFSMAEKTVGASIFAQSIINKNVGETEEVTQRGIYSSNFNPGATTQLTTVLEKYHN